MLRLGPNPLSEFVALVEKRITAQEKGIGEALPHLYLAKDFIHRLHALAESDAEYLWKNA